MDRTYCRTCGALDSMIVSYDNHCCGECGDTEGLLWEDDPRWDEIVEEEG